MGKAQLLEWCQLNADLVWLTQTLCDAAINSKPSCWTVIQGASNLLRDSNCQVLTERDR